MEVIKASLDRFEGEYAVIYSDDGIKYDVPKSMTHSRAGSKIVLYLEAGQVVKIEADKRATDETRDRIRKKYKRLKRGEHLL